MKKLFTLITLMLATLSISAKSQVTLGTFSSWGDGCTVSGNTISMTEAWKGAGCWLASEQGCVDWSEGDYLELHISNCTGGLKAAVEFNDGKTVDANGNPTKVDALTTTASFGDGDTIVFVPLNQDNSDKVVNVWIQSTTSSASVTIGNAYLTTSDEYQAYLDEKSKGEQIAWEGSYDFGTAWDTNIMIDASKFATANSGATFTFTYTVGSENYAQIKICNSSWQALTSPKGQNQWNCVDLDMNATSYSTVLSDDDLATIKTGGMILQGYNNTLTKIAFNNPTTNGINNMTAVKKIGDNATYNLAGQRVNKNYKGVVIRNGKKLLQK